MKSNLIAIDQEMAQILGIQESYVKDNGLEIFVMPQVFESIFESLVPEPFKGRSRDLTLLQNLWEWRYSKPCPENIVVWENSFLSFEMRQLNKELESLQVKLTLQTELGEVFEADFELSEAVLHMPSPNLPDLKAYNYQLQTAWKLPFGYHNLKVETNQGVWHSQVISSPEKLNSFQSKDWGVFVPTYALRSSDDMGVGSYKELQELSLLMAKNGANTVATLPLLPVFLEEWKCDPNPYSPASRLFWNEFYVDPRQAPEWQNCKKAQKIYNDSKAIIERFRTQEWVPYLEIAKLKREILQPMAEEFFSVPNNERLKKSLIDHPELEEYARFRAYTMQRGESWRTWEAEYKKSLEDAPVSKELFQLFLYSQILALEQLHGLSQKSKSLGMNFYLDLPMGVHSDSYDVWKHSQLYCTQLSAGAPPDLLFTKGQNWGFPPFHPQTLHQDRFNHFQKIIRHHLSETSLLRLDHVMGLHRLYVIPNGFGAHEGAYIRFPFKELYATLLLEASRVGARLVGEDLGTVPEEVRIKMNQHQLDRLFVFQNEANSFKEKAITPPHSNTVSCLNTLDMPMWASYWRGLDLKDRLELGLLNAETLITESANREKIKKAWVTHLKELSLLGENFGIKDESQVLGATLAYLGESESALVLFNLEDAFFETRPQNTPGTFKERPNWQGRMKHTLKAMEQDPQLRSMIYFLQRSRGDARQKSC